MDLFTFCSTAQKLILHPAALNMSEALTRLLTSAQCLQTPCYLPKLWARCFTDVLAFLRLETSQ